MGSARNAGVDSQGFDHDKDRYLDFKTLLRRIVAEADLPEGPIMRLEVTCLASGEATYRVWAARAEEPEGGYIPGPTS